MRIHFKAWARPELAAWPYFIDAPEQQCGKWASVFKNPNAPIFLELGCGKGSFLATHALTNPNINYLGVDIKPEMLGVCRRTIVSMFENEKKELSNVALARKNIEQISEVFSAKDAIKHIYINFCNPWYKTKHAKHRLTHPRQLVQYRDFLAPNAEIWFKTDDERLFVDSLRYFSVAGFSVVWKTTDLHRENLSTNILTEHEKIFSSDGIPIKACIAQMQAAKIDKNSIFRLKNI